MDPEGSTYCLQRPFLWGGGGGGVASGLIVPAAFIIGATSRDGVAGDATGSRKAVVDSSRWMNHQTLRPSEALRP